MVTNIQIYLMIKILPALWLPGQHPHLTLIQVVIDWLNINLYDVRQRKFYSSKGGQMLDLKLREINDSLSTKERLVADYILANKPLLKSMSIQSLAKANDVSTTTILRLCHKLGYQGFSDLKIDLITSSGSHNHEKILQEDINLDDSIESVNHKIQLIEKSSIDETHAIVNVEQLDQASELARTLAHSDFVALKHGDACRVIASVLETLQATGEHGGGVTRAGVSYDSTHEV